MIPIVVSVVLTRADGSWSARLEYSGGTYGKRRGPYRSLWEVAQAVSQEESHTLTR